MHYNEMGGIAPKLGSIKFYVLEALLKDPSHSEKTLLDWCQRAIAVDIKNVDFDDIRRKDHVIPQSLEICVRIYTDWDLNEHLGLYGKDPDIYESITVLYNNDARPHFIGCALNGTIHTASALFLTGDRKSGYKEDMKDYLGFEQVLTGVLAIEALTYMDGPDYMPVLCREQGLGSFLYTARNYNYAKYITPRILEKNELMSKTQLGCALRYIDNILKRGEHYGIYLENLVRELRVLNNAASTPDNVEKLYMVMAMIDFGLKEIILRRSLREFDFPLCFEDSSKTKIFAKS